MNDLRHYINIIEARSHPELNPKTPTSDIFDQYQKKYGNSVYVHFNQIEKVGINPRSQNTFGPVGIYAMAISIASSYGLSAAKMADSKYANILIPTPDANVLDLNTVDISKMQDITKQALAFHKKKIKNKSSFYLNYEIPTSVEECWREIVSLLYDYSRRRQQRLMSTLTSFFRRIGFDAINDSKSIINDNPDQIVFMTPGSYKVLETIPLRYK